MPQFTVKQEQPIARDSINEVVELIQDRLMASRHPAGMVHTISIGRTVLATINHQGVVKYSNRATPYREPDKCPACADGRVISMGRGVSRCSNGDRCEGI